MAEREGFESAALIFPTKLENFCCHYQRYQSLATAAQVHSTSILGKSNRSLFGSNGSQDEGIEILLNARIKEVSGKSGNSVTLNRQAKWS